MFSTSHCSSSRSAVGKGVQIPLRNGETRKSLSSFLFVLELRALASSIAHLLACVCRMWWRSPSLCVTFCGRVVLLCDTGNELRRNGEPRHCCAATDPPAILSGCIEYGHSAMIGAAVGWWFMASRCSSCPTSADHKCQASTYPRADMLLNAIKERVGKTGALARKRDERCDEFR